MSDNLPACSENDPNAPWNNEDDNTCPECGRPCDKDYCSEECFKASEN